MITQMKCVSCPYYLGIVKCANAPCEECIRSQMKDCENRHENSSAEKDRAEQKI
ncbi:MAG: hypothetical protein MJ095_07080 [Oscillospiraceae bacterium]|nr:hypothetical protein [Oscillospiraceae bacterium]